MTFWETRKVEEDNLLKENKENKNETTEHGSDKGKESFENFKQEVEIANDNIFNLISSYPDLVSHIAEGLRKNPSNNQQQFLVLWYIAWETANYLKEKDKSVYEDMYPILNKYINLVNKAKQSLNDINFYNMFSDLTEKIEENADRLPKNNSKRPWNNPFSTTWERTFYKQEGSSADNIPS